MNARNILPLSVLLLFAACAAPAAQPTTWNAPATPTASAPAAAPSATTGVLPSATAALPAATATPLPPSPTLPPPAATASPQPTAVPAASAPIALDQNVALQPQQPYETAFSGEAGQPATLMFTPPAGGTAPDFTLTAPDGTVVFAGKGARVWAGLLPQSGAYRLAVAPPAAATGLAITLYQPYRQPQTLQNTEIGYSLTYDAPDFAPDMPGLLPNEVDGLRLTAPLGETLEGAYLLVTLEPTTNWHQCLDAPPTAEVGTVTVLASDAWPVNGEGYKLYDVEMPVFADSTFFDRQFRAYYMPTARCVTVHLLLHADRPGDRVNAQDRQAAWAHLMRAFLSMIWTP